jgi:hypothetical protein
MNTKHAKMEIHGEGAGEITEGDIQRRAREIALIKGRESRDPTVDDMEEARAELSGDTVSAVTTDNGESSGGLSRDPSEPSSNYGSQTPNILEPDEQEALEHLTLEGVEEAQHEQMLESRRSQPSNPSL